MATATFRFYQELNDFLPPERRRREFASPCARAATTKHMIEALGVPHTEVELILVNGESVGFDRQLADGDRVAVYPRFEALDVTPLLRVREYPLRQTRFVADAHLGGLAHLLRMLGFDTLYDNHFHDDDMVAIAGKEGRILLSRDRELLKRRSVTHGCYLHAQKPEQQLREIVERLDLARSARPFTLCLHCNAPLRPVDGDQRDALAGAVDQNPFHVTSPRSGHPAVQAESTPGAARAQGYIRFISAVQVHHRQLFLDALENRWNSGYQRCLQHLRRLLDAIPAEVLNQRLILMSLYLGTTLAARETALEQASRSNRLWRTPWALDNLVDTLCGMLQQPPSAETLRSMKPAAGAGRRA